MLGRNRHSLRFPNLVFEDETTWTGSMLPLKSNTKRIYRLDWGNFDSISIKNHKKWVESRCEFNPDSDPSDYPYQHPLPSVYEKCVREARFAINQAYMKEIRYNAEQAVEVWGRQRGFDTCVREFCLGPAISHVKVAFYLLDDCLCAEGETCFARDDRCVFLYHAMLYRFWFDQTGRGLLKRNADFQQLRDRIKYGPNSEGSGVVLAANDFFKAMDDHEKVIGRHIAPITDEDKNEE